MSQAAVATIAFTKAAKGTLEYELAKRGIKTIPRDKVRRCRRDVLKAEREKHGFWGRHWMIPRLVAGSIVRFFVIAALAAAGMMFGPTYHVWQSRLSVARSLLDGSYSSLP